MEELNTPIFAQAKVEYTAQLVDVLYTHMFDGVKSIYEESKVIYSSRKGMPILLVFRELLEKVPIWNSEIIDSECSRIINNSNCDWIDDLITAVFISHTKILTSIGPNQSFQRINVTIPKTSTFIHKSYINTARELWKNPYLFNENVPGYEFQKNNKEIENIIKKCIENTIRNLLPIKEILREHLEGETDSILNQKEILKQLLRDELKNIRPHQIVEDSDDHDKQEGDEEPDNESSKDDNVTAEDKNSNMSELTPDTNSSPTIIKEADISIDDVDDVDDGVELVPLLKDKLEEIIDKEEKLINELKKLETEGNTSITPSPSSDVLGDDPTDDQVKKECSDIVVNDITIPVDVPGESNPQTTTDLILPAVIEPVVEIRYDNVDLTARPADGVTIDQDRLKRLVTNMEIKEEINVIKSDEVAKPINDIPVTIHEPEYKPSFSFSNLYPNMNDNTTNDNTTKPSDMVTPLQIISEDKQIADEPKSPRKEVVIVRNDDTIDDTSSLVNFFDDMKKIVEEKGIKVEKNNDKSFTLFEDAPEVEK